MSSRPVVSVLSTRDAPLHEDAVKLLKEKFIIKFVTTKGWISDEEVISEVAGSDAILVRIGRVDKPVMDVCPKLRIISVHGVGFDRVDVDVASRRGILVTYTPGANAQSVAELTVGLIITVLRRLHLIRDKMAEGGWDDARVYGTGYEIYGKVVGLVGIGNIGSRVAKVVKAMEASEVLAYDPYVPESKASSLGVRLVDLETLLRKSDIVSIHAPLTKETYHLINEDRLKLMKPTSVIINTSRGGLINTEALYRALKEGWIAGAALDVTDPEPLPKGHPLYGLPNVVITPHIGGSTYECWRRVSLTAAEEIIRRFEGLPPLNPVNPQVLK
ncbi:MAG: hydroxyacid dehydrogenase [Sulfolobales archaeon]|nr:hydroxyacid dehydrogenase [Sulfolobales archaeon]MCX8186133.1 hydroxyacid dehydrogenase [Sulfolobales archaeon]MDW7969428.1 hydroxyacid dehydrogenase [Sulfolobales archaeon]